MSFTANPNQERDNQARVWLAEPIARPAISLEVFLAASIAEAFMAIRSIQTGAAGGKTASAAIGNSTVNESA